MKARRYRLKELLMGIILVYSPLSPPLNAQTISHPWHVIDLGGGKSTAGGLTLQSSIGQPATQAGGSGGINLEGGYIPGIRQLSGALTNAGFESENSWNMISVPLIVDDER